MESMVFSAGTGFHSDVPPKPPDNPGEGMEKPSFKDKDNSQPAASSGDDAEVLGAASDKHAPRVQEGPISNDSVSVDKIPQSLHGDWLIVQRKKRVNKQKESSKHQSQGRHDHTKGNKYISLSNPDLGEQNVESVAVLQAQKANSVKTTMIGNIKIYDLGGGIKSTMPLQRMEGSKLVLEDSETQQLPPQSKDASNDDDAMDHEDKLQEDNADYDRGPSPENMLAIGA
ncbi:hypothetical protein SESBI_46216 [Sesbania bispinosa]|nr:hypothetical protein SESBI_46216 [Sesbania bispinosa]